MRHFYWAALLLAGCITTEGGGGGSGGGGVGGGGGGGGPTAKTCDAVCPKVVSCWLREADELGGGYGYIDDGYIGQFSYDGCSYGYGYGYGYGYCSPEEVEEAAVERCLRGCYADLRENEGMIACIAEQSCPTLLEVCLGADFHYGY